MRRHDVVFLLLLLLVAGIAGAGLSAQEDDSPQVGIVVDRTLSSLSFLNDDDGQSINELTAIFQSLGAEVTTLPLDRAIPEEIDVIVLVRPVNELNAVQLARLWASMDNGANLFLTLDPRNYQNVRGERPNSGLDRLMYLEYGTGLTADFLVAPWFSGATLANLAGTLLQAHPEDIVGHPVTQPLRDYDLSVLVWAGRSVEVYPLWPDAQPSPLLYSEIAYGETSLPNTDAFNLDVNIGQDRQGRLFVGSLSENLERGTRLVLLGDSEMVGDRYGLSLSAGSRKPNFPGNYILAQRLAAWILELPEDEWPPLPEEFSWYIIDGDPSDWDTSQPRTESTLGTFQIVHNNEYLYLLLEDDTTTELEIRFVIDNIIPVDLRLSVEGGVQHLTDSGMEPVLDGAVAAGEVFEARIPLRLIGVTPVIAQVCRGDPCSMQTIRSHLLGEDDPARLRFAPQPLATVVSAGLVQVQVQPSTEAEPVGAVFPNLPYLLLGRSADNLWVKVQDGLVSGWIENFHVIANTDLSTLPVLDE